jgi:MYXO-CTERM domain-containing protein
MCRNGCVAGHCANSDPGVLTGGVGCSAAGAGANLVWVLAAVLLVVARRRRRRAMGAGAVVLALMGAPVRAQTSVSTGAAVDTFRSAAPGSDWFSTDSLDFRGTVRPSARVQLDYGHALLEVRNADGSVRSIPIQNQVWFHVGAGVTLFDRVRVFANLPIAAFQNGGMSPFGGQPLVAGNAGVGDVGFGADVRLLGTYSSPFTLAVGATMTAPSGSSSNMLGDGSASVMPRVMAAGQAGMFAWAAQVGFNFRGASIGSINFGNELRFAASGGVKLFDQRLLVGPEFFAVAPVTSSGTSRTFGLEGDLGAHFAITPQWRVGAGVGMGLVNAAGIPDVRALASVDWTMGYAPPVPPDADGDGVADADDACPNEKGLSARGGCAAPPDDDGDGIANADDLCPKESSVGAADPRRPGCALALDSDGDGVPDAQDECPNAAPTGPMNPKRPGCADRDDDGDGVLASVDECPAVPAGPRADPAHPGCPIPDADGDTVPDALDHCPNQAGAPAMEANANGCPGLVRLEEDHLLTNSPVYFKAGTATLLPKSFPVLEAAKSALLAMSSVEHVVVEGHTDAKGTVPGNQALSEARAKAVVTWLVEHGVSASRLEAVGYGMTKLLIPGEKSEADRQTNRRVEFRIK